jgi:hypothetical protein
MVLIPGPRVFIAQIKGHSGTFPFSINAHYKEQPRDKQPELKIDIILEAKHDRHGYLLSK